MNNTLKAIESPSDLNHLITQRDIVVLTSFRGPWCPFCLLYFKKINSNLAHLNDALVIDVSVYPWQQSTALAKKLNLKFDLISDENLVMHKMLGVKTGSGHGKEAFLQPSVFIYKKGTLVYQWIQTPKMLNLGGAVSRLSVGTLIEEVKRA